MNRFPFIDIHTHSERCPQEGVVTVKNIFPGEKFAAFSGKNFYSAGLHPWHIGTREANNEAMYMVEDALTFDHVIFVGETGLDKTVNNDFTEQKRVFKAHAFFAEKHNYPLIIHSVKSNSEVMALRKKMRPAMPWIMHGYTGNPDTTKQMEKLGFMFSFGSILQNSNAKAVDSFKYLTLDKIFLETDDTKINIETIYEQAARLKQMPVPELKYAIWKNLNRIESTLLEGTVRK